MTDRLKKFEIEKFESRDFNQLSQLNENPIRRFFFNQRSLKNISLTQRYLTLLSDDIPYNCPLSIGQMIRCPYCPLPSTNNIVAIIK